MRMCLQHEPEQRPQTGTDVLKLLLREDEELPAELAAPASSAASLSGLEAIELARRGAPMIPVGVVALEASASHSIGGATGSGWH
jgi:hypothetical protein